MAPQLCGAIATKCAFYHFPELSTLTLIEIWGTMNQSCALVTLPSLNLEQLREGRHTSAVKESQQELGS